jgi:pullulanase
MKTGSIIVLVFISLGTLAQVYTDNEKLSGYHLDKDRVDFIFDPSVYSVEPNKVAVTGAFRNWDSNMEEPKWELSPNGDTWTLQIDNSGYRILAPGTPFKFRINDGRWMDPPSEAPNSIGGNLVFLHDVEMPSLKAEILSNGQIIAEVNGDRPLVASAYSITDAEGNEIGVTSVLPNTSTKTLIIPAGRLDPRRVYYLHIPSLGLSAWCSYDGWFRTLYSDKELGANIHNGQTAVRLFAPRATGVNLFLYKGKDDKQADRVIAMERDDNGVWEAFFNEDLHGTWYDFTIEGFDEPGNHFYSTTPVHFTDPYARVSDNTWGKARIWHPTEPATPLKNGIPPMKDVIAYEVHVQDFTDLLPVEDHLKGTLPAMTIPGLTNSRGEPIGFDHLVNLGVNTVHLMPVQEYLHFPDDDWRASFENDPYMIEQGVNRENYQWGYRTSHFFAIESKYRSRDAQPGDEREQFRDLVQAFHDKGMAVIIDIVPNHTAEDMGGDRQYFNFNAIDKMYYYRTKDFDHIGEYGNEVKTENRPMVQRWLIDQCLHFIHEFGIDGFRIDLAGQIDQQTLAALKKAIGDDKILYGEAWIASNDPAYENNPDWDWYKEDAPITFFQDDSRNAYKGPVFELNDKYKDRGWAGGKYDERVNVMRGLSASFPTDKTTTSGITYLDIHDNFALADQFATSDFDGRFAVDQDRYKIAVTLLYTTPGPIVTHGGSEFMRSKGLAPPKEVVKTTKAGFVSYFHGKRDTYNHRAANRFSWENIGAKAGKKNRNDYQNMLAFWKGMNAFRNSEAGAAFRIDGVLPDGYYQFYAPDDERLLGYMVDGRILVLLNAGDEALTFPDLSLPPGDWRLIANNASVDHVNGAADREDVMLLNGQYIQSIRIPAQGLYIWLKQ